MSAKSKEQQDTKFAQICTTTTWLSGKPPRLIDVGPGGFFFTVLDALREAKPRSEDDVLLCVVEGRCRVRAEHAPNPGDKNKKLIVADAEVEKTRRRPEWLKCCSREELQQFSRVPNSLAQTRGACADE